METILTGLGIIFVFATGLVGVILARNFILVKEDEVVLVRAWNKTGPIDHVKRQEPETSWQWLGKAYGRPIFQDGIFTGLIRIIGWYYPERIKIDQESMNLHVKNVYCIKDGKRLDLEIKEASVTFVPDFFAVWPDGTNPNQKQAAAAASRFMVAKTALLEKLKDYVEEAVANVTSAMSIDEALNLSSDKNLGKTLLTQVNEKCKEGELPLRIIELLINEKPQIADESQRKAYEEAVKVAFELDATPKRLEKERLEAANRAAVAQKDGEAEVARVQAQSKAYGLDNVTPELRTKALIDLRRLEALEKFGSNSDMVNVMGGGKGSPLNALLGTGNEGRNNNNRSGGRRRP